MSRVAALSIVMAMAIGPSTALVCRTWCEPQATTAGDCHHDSGPSPRVTRSDGCLTVVVSATIVRENLRRTGTTSVAQNLIVGLRYQLAPATTSHQPHRDATHLRSFNPPLVTVLRL